MSDPDHDTSKDSKSKRGWRRRTRVTIATVGSLVLAATVSYVVPKVLDSISLGDEGSGLAIDVAQDVAGAWFFPNTDISQLHDSPNCEGGNWKDWAIRNNGLPAAPTLVRVTVTATKDVTAIIEGFSVVRAEYKPPAGITIGCRVGDIVADRTLVVDLDAAAPTVRYEDPNAPLRDAPYGGANRFAFKLSKGDVERFLIVGAGERSAYKWHPTMTVLTGTDRKVYPLLNGEDEFEHIPSSLYPLYLQDGTGRFSPPILP